MSTGLLERIFGRTFSADFAAAQPRWPKGDPRGGQWKSQQGGGTSGTASSFRPADKSDSDLIDLFNKMSSQSKLHDGVMIAQDAMLKRAKSMLTAMNRDPETRERAMQVIQNQDTGDIMVSPVGVGKFGSYKPEPVPPGHIRIGMLHTHPPGHPVEPSEQDMWGINPMQRTGGTYMIAGFQDGKHIVRQWIIRKGEYFEGRYGLPPARTTIL